MGNTETYLRVPPKQSSFGPWFYHADEIGLGDKAFMGVTSFFVTFAVLEFILLFGIFSEYANIKDKAKKSEYLKRTALRYGSIFFMIFLGWAILGSSFSYTWRQGFLSGELPYRIGLADRVPMRLGLHVGLRGINVTLVHEPHSHPAGVPINRFNCDENHRHCEIIQYNEQYLWSRGQGAIGGWLHGRFGFGPYSNLLAQQFRAGQRRGTPLPILETLEWLTIDGESIRWHRWYHNAGYYAHVFLWMAFTFWVLTAVTTVIRPATGMFWLGLTGFSMWFAAAVYHGLTEKAEPSLAIPFEGHFLRPTFGWAYYLNLVVGIIVNLMAIIGWYVFEKLGYTTDAFSLSIGSFEKPKDIVKSEPKPLEEVTEKPSVAPTPARVGSHQGTFRRSRSTFGGPRLSIRESNRVAPTPARPGSSNLRGRSSRRTKKAFGKRIDGGQNGSVQKPQPQQTSRPAPSLASLGNKLDDIDEVEMDTIREEGEEAVAETSTTEV